MFIADSTFWNLAKTIKAVAHIGCNAVLGLFRIWVANGYSECAVFSLYRQNREFKLNQALAQSNQALAAIKTTFALSYITEAGSRPGGRVTFLARTRNVTQRMRPDCPRPDGFAFGQTCVTPFSLRCGKTRFALRAPLKHIAANWMSKHWHSSVPMPAARTACRRRRHTGGSGYGRPARVVTKLASSPISDCGSSY